MKKFQKVTIVGVGLMGGAFGMALRNKRLAHKVVGLGRNISKLKLAKKLGALDEYTLNPQEAFKDSDLIMISVPVKIVPQFIDQIEKYAQKNTIVIDVGSTKLEILAYADKKFSKNIQFVGCHPLAGSEKSGVSSAKGSLYADSICIITKTTKTKSAAVERVKKLWNLLGAYVYIMPGSRHDRIVAQISHLPHIAAAALVQTLENKNSQFAASGFKDTTRIAESEAVIWRDICLTNQKAILRELDRYIKELSKWKKMLKTKNPNQILKAFSKASEKRKKIKDQRPKTKDRRL